MTVIDLPWPVKDLHPNARPHWSVKARATKKARSDAYFAARASGASWMAADAISVAVVFSPPDKRLRDQDGMLSSVKAYLDGIADAIGVDDQKWELSIRKDEPVKNGNVRITITPAQGTDHV